MHVAFWFSFAFPLSILTCLIMLGNFLAPTSCVFQLSVLPRHGSLLPCHCLAADNAAMPATFAEVEQLTHTNGCQIH